LAVSLTSLGDDAPSGSNVEYEAVFTDLMLAAQPAEERQVGTQITPQQEADPAIIIQRATAVLERSHDLRAAVLLGYGELRVNGFPAFATATGADSTAFVLTVLAPGSPSMGSRPSSICECCDASDGSVGSVGSRDNHRSSEAASANPPATASARLDQTETDRTSEPSTRAR
jgi:hypothetical protein